MASLLPKWLQPEALSVFSKEPQRRHRDGTEAGASTSAISEVPSFSSSGSNYRRDDSRQTLGYPGDQEEPDSVPSHLVTLPSISFALGFGTGLYQSANRASLVFMAENAHRRPDTVQGWYFYNKTKNYKVLLGGIKGGMKTGTKLSAWVAAFLFLDEAFGASRYSIGNYYRRLKDERRRWKEGKKSSSNSTPGSFMEAAETLEETAIDTFQASIDTIRGIASGGSSSIDTSPPMIDFPASTYSTRSDIRQLEGLSKPQSDLTGYPAQTYSTQADVKQLEEMYAADSLARPAPWWSKRAAEARKSAGGKWIDGFFAGSVTAILAVALYRIPAPASIRTFSLGSVAGSATGAMRDLQSWIEAQRAKESEN